MVRIFHTSDTHLGHQQYSRLDASGLNQREQDIYSAWHKVIDAAVGEKPDLFIHAGDLFDGVRPSNRALHHAMQGFLKLSQAGIPTFVIAGNHEHPKLRETGSAFRLFEHLPHVHVAYQGRRETHKLTVGQNEVRVHAVPQCQDNEVLAAEIAAAPTESEGLDVLIVHGAIHSLPSFAHAEFNELTLDPSWFAPFDYVALGHYHGAKEITPNAWYCGAPERVSMSESGEEKGFLDVRLTPSPTAKFRPLAGRTYMDLGRLDATGMDAAAVRSAAESAIARIPPGAVARLRILELDSALRGALDVRALEAAGKHALVLDLRLEYAGKTEYAAGSAEFGRLTDEFDAFLSQNPAPGLDRKRLADIARQVLEDA